MIVRISFMFLVMLLMGLDVHAAVGVLDIESLKTGVVRITATEGNKTKVGTGFIVKLDPEIVYIVTAAHVVAGDFQPKVQFFTQQDVRTSATVKHIEDSDDVTALALLVIRGKENIPSGLAAMFLATSARFVGADEVIMIGHPRQAGEWAVLTGAIVSRQGRYVTIDANIDEGNSGGPIIHTGQVVGLIGGAQRYGKGVTIGTIREYLDGHGVLVQVPETQGAATVPAPSPKGIRPEHQRTFPKEITGKDRAPMILIPAGNFWMGSPDGEGERGEHPRHQVTLDGFYMDKFEVTVARYAEFVRAKKRSQPRFWNQVDSSKHRNLPVVGVDWHDAKAYCEWAGKRLPTEAEWEKAARGTDGRTYPWGNEQPTARLANFGKALTNNFYDNRLVPVDSYEAGISPYGLHHMAGNVWEWTADWYDQSFYRKSPEHNPTGSSDGEDRVVRGGSWFHAPVDARSARRPGFPPTTRDSHTGFRCAQDVPN